MAGHSATAARVGGGAASTQPAHTGGRDRPPAGAGVRRHTRPNLGIHTMDAADGGERRPRVGAGTCDGDQGHAGAGQADADA
eukprot:2628504-Pleurochrysis_carterae.AAC.1